MNPPPMPTPARYAGSIEPDFYTADQLAARDAQWAALLADAVAAERERLATMLNDMADLVTQDGIPNERWIGIVRGFVEASNAIRAQTDSKG